MLKMRRSYKIALAAVSCAIAVIAVVAQAYVSTLSIAINVIAALAISLPLTQRSVAGAVFSYVATALIGFLAVNIKALPFIVFYAPYAIIAYVLDFVFYPSAKVRLPKWTKIVAITVIKLGYFGAAFYACIALMKVVVTDIALFGWQWTLPLLMALGFVAFCVYDPLYRFVFINMSRIVARYAGGNRRNAGRPDAPSKSNAASVEPLDGDVFEGFADKEENGGDTGDADKAVDGKKQVGGNAAPENGGEDGEKTDASEGKKGGAA